MEVWYFDYLDNFPSALFTSSASLTLLSVMTSHSVLYLRMYKRAPLKKIKMSAVALFVSLECFIVSLKLG